MEQFSKQNKLATMSTPKCRARLMQGLGLPPNSGNDVFYEFWVGENDLFRPAVDSSLQSTMLPYNVSASYFEKLAIFSKLSYFSPNLLQRYPFTALGYTYDCSPESKDHIGMSEFVLKPNKTVYVRSVTNTMDYIKRLKK